MRLPLASQLLFKCFRTLRTRWVTIWKTDIRYTALDIITDNLLNPFFLKAFALNKFRFACSRLFVHVGSVDISDTSYLLLV